MSAKDKNRKQLREEVRALREQLEASRRAEAELRRSDETRAARLREYAQRFLAVQEEERRHLARELHDEVGQMLTGLKLLLENAAGPQQGPVQPAMELLQELTDRVRDLSLRLRPTLLDDLGLQAALPWLLQRYTAQTGVQVQFEPAGLECRFPAEVETASYRLVQEALTNVARHAGVREATVRTWVADGQFFVQVQDEGSGFDARAVLADGTTLGLAGMYERTALLGGRLTIESQPGAGTRLTATLAIAPRDEFRPS
jgi:signal transduction histidine kinase